MSRCVVSSPTQVSCDRDRGNTKQKVPTQAEQVDVAPGRPLLGSRASRSEPIIAVNSSPGPAIRSSLPATSHPCILGALASGSLPARYRDTRSRLPFYTFVRFPPNLEIKLATQNLPHQKCSSHTFLL